MARQLWQFHLSLPQLYSDCGLHMVSKMARNVHDPERELNVDCAPGNHIVGVEFTKERMGQYNESYGPLKLYVDDKVVAESEIRMMTGHFSLCGEGLCVGCDSSDPVSSEYGSKSQFTGGTIKKVVFDCGRRVCGCRTAYAGGTHEGLGRPANDLIL